MPCYNAAHTITQSISSILAQTYKNWELIIVDDFSKDDSYDVIKKYYHHDNRIEFFSHRENLGVAAARNKGLDNAQGDYIAFLDFLIPIKLIELILRHI